jgi:hypothetical protein
MQQENGMVRKKESSTSVIERLNHGGSGSG